MNKPIEIKDVIRQARMACHFTQKELAKRLGVSTSAVAQWEVGNNNPTIDKVVDLCKMLGIPTSDVFGPGKVFQGVLIQTSEEFELISMWKRIASDNDREFFLNFLERLVYVESDMKKF